MNTIGQGTTPYLQVAIEGYDISKAAVIHFAIEQGGGKKLYLTGERVTAAYEDGTSVVTAHLTQEETLGLNKGLAELQIRWKDAEGDTYIIEPITVNIMRALYKGVI